MTRATPLHQYTGKLPEAEGVAPPQRAAEGAADAGGGGEAASPEAAAAGAAPQAAPAGGHAGGGKGGARLAAGAKQGPQGAAPPLLFRSAVFLPSNAGLSPGPIEGEVAWRWAGSGGGGLRGWCVRGWGASAGWGPVMELFTLTARWRADPTSVHIIMHKRNTTSLHLTPSAPTP